jgi:hypothetical protein
VGGLASGLIAALLPEAERRSFCDRTGADALRGSFALGALQVFVGGPWWVWLAVDYVRQVSDATAAGMLASGDGATLHGARFALVALGPLAYLISAPGLGLGYVVATGLLRLINAGVQSQPLGDPLLAIGAWALHRTRGGWRERALRARLGPERPDRLGRRGSELRVVAARAKPDWTDRATIQIGEDFYRMHGASLRPDGRHEAWVYSLAPLEAGALIRQPIRYRPDRGPEPVPAPESGSAVGQPAPPAASAAPATPEIEPEPETGASRRRWRVDDGEQARLTPGAPTAGVVESRGFLPLRARGVGDAVRPDLPGTALRVGQRWFEVVSESAEEDVVCYGLEPWPHGQVMRDTVRYEPALVRGAQRERRLAAERTRLRRRTWPAYPLVGLLPETRQRLVCDRLGLEPELATASSAVLELAAIGWLLAGGVRDPASDPTGASLYAMLGGALLLGPVAALALLRGLGAAALGTVSGSVVLTPFLRLSALLGPGVERFDANVVPLTRAAFWARLAQPDRQRREPDGALLVESPLPLLSWTRPPRLQWSGDVWRVEARPPRLEAGRLVYAYRLVPAASEGPAAVALPPRNLYQQEVLQGVSQDWADLLSSGFGPLVSLLPTAVQRRALGSRGGPAALRGATLASALAEALVGGWWASGGDLAMLLAGGALGADALVRLLQLARGEYAPSLFGGLFADALRPERRPYRAHLAAEREALAALAPPPRER